MQQLVFVVDNEYVLSHVLSAQLPAYGQAGNGDRRRLLLIAAWPSFQYAFRPNNVIFNEEKVNRGSRLYFCQAVRRLFCPAPEESTSNTALLTALTLAIQPHLPHRLIPPLPAFARAPVPVTAGCRLAGSCSTASPVTELRSIASG
ncbi:hypothetical protein [Thermogemmatispora sp.]|uniref:hypothetical protein n=1 Tax=Thermogemmatispora sp. TaxID=1968838 RepID=UPI001DF31722|nr:hypothetical protein [Thermogemmatispora sp.]MBX5448823.1 hypothetical protein [Thermogemmatispora sp.]